MSNITHSEVAFVDSAIPDLDGFLSAIRPEVDVIVIDRSRPGLAQIALALKHGSGLDAVHIVAHGRSGEVYLGSDVISLDTINKHGSELKLIGQSMEGQLLLWSCYYTASADSFLFASGIFTNLQDPVATTQTYANAVNDNGQVAGYEVNNTGQHGFLYSSGTYIALDDPQAAGTTDAVGINSSGEIAGYYFDSNSLPHGFVYSAGTYTTVDDPLETHGTYLQAINDSGEVVGNYFDKSGEHGFVYNSGTYSTLDAPQATGTTHAVGINGSTYSTLDDPMANGGDTHPMAINGSGQIVGYTDNSGQHGFLYSNGTYTTIVDPSTTQEFTGITAINDSGEMTGYYEPVSAHGFATV